LHSEPALAGTHCRRGRGWGDGGRELMRDEDARRAVGLRK
jgi:hypothetical protein